MVSLIALALLKAPLQTSLATAQAVVRASADKLRAAESVSGEFVGILPRSGQVILRGEFQLKKPFFYRVVQPGLEYHSDGRTAWHYVAAAREYTRRPAVGDGALDVPLYAFGELFGPDLVGSLPYMIKRSRVSMTTLEGRRCAALAVSFASLARDDYMIFYFDAAREMPVGWDQEFGGRKVRYRYRNVTLDPKIDPRVFRWQPPPGAKERKRKA